MSDLSLGPYVWRRKTRYYRSKRVKTTAKYSPCFMVWGWIAYGGTGNLMRAQTTMKAKDYIEILDECLPFDDFIVLQDGASVHRAGMVDDFFYGNNIQTIEDFPPQSPDLNPIEHVWPPSREA